MPTTTTSPKRTVLTKREVRRLKGGYKLGNDGQPAGHEAEAMLGQRERVRRRR